MNQQLQVFNHEQFGDVRIIEEDGRVLFCGSDVAKALGYANCIFWQTGSSMRNVAAISRSWDRIGVGIATAHLSVTSYRPDFTRR